MPDIADDRAAFREAMARAEAASGIERDADGVEINGIESIVRGETPVATPELEGAVPVTASDQPLTPEPVVQTDTSGEQQQEAPAVEPTVDELKAQLAAAEARIEEQKNMIGRQSAEVGETRQSIAELQAQIAAVQAQQAAPQVPLAPITQDDIENNPAEAAQRALALRDQAALERAFAVWKDPMHPMGDPFAAATWLNERRLEAQKQEFEAQLAETRKEFETATAPLVATSQESKEQAQWVAAFDEVKAKHADIFAVDPTTGASTAERLITAAGTQPEYAAFKEMLQNGDASTKAAALSALYALDKVGNPDALRAQLEQGAQEAAAEAAAALASAGAVTSQSTVGQGTELKTESELEAERYKSRMSDKPSLARGWTGRTVS